MAATSERNMDSADGTKDLEMGRLSWIIREGPKRHHKCPCEKDPEGDLTTEEEESRVTMEGRGWGDKRKGLEVKECTRPPETRKGEEVTVLSGSRRIWPR